MDKIIPVVTLKSMGERTSVLNALKNNNINCAEICFRTDCAEQAITLAVKEFPEMNIGAGLYFVAIGGTLIMILVQCVLHINCKLFNLKHMYRINISFIQTDKGHEKIKEIFGVKHFQKLSVVRGERTIFNVSITTEKEIASDEIDSIIKNNDFIISVERCDD